MPYKICYFVFIIDDVYPIVTTACELGGEAFVYVLIFFQLMMIATIYTSNPYRR